MGLALHPHSALDPKRPRRSHPPASPLPECPFRCAMGGLVPTGYNDCGWGRIHHAALMAGPPSLHRFRLIQDLAVSLRDQSFTATVVDNRRFRLTVCTTTRNEGLTTACRDSPCTDLATAFRLKPSMSASVDIEGYCSQHRGGSHSFTLAHLSSSHEIYPRCLACLAMPWYDTRVRRCIRAEASAKPKLSVH